MKYECYMHDFTVFFSITEETAGREQVQKVHHQTDQGSPVVQQKL